MLTQIALLKKYGLAVRGNLGQHLLVDSNIQRKIVDLLGEDTSEPVLEIGPGLGALTAHLLERGFSVTAVEKDRRFVEILEREFGEKGGGRFRLIASDILDCDLEKIFTGVKDKNKKIKVLGNLPYYITAPILFRLLEAGGSISRAVLTVQKEVAARFVASPGTKDYGRLSLAVRYSADVRHAFDVSPGCFTPRPEVDSSTVVLDFYPSKSSCEKGFDRFLFHLVQVAFGQRRKTLIHNLMGDPSLEITREELLGFFERKGILPTVRGEELFLKDYLALAKGLRKFQRAKSGGGSETKGR
jgi:16S rRNA (adenine1518-N6/adenine1519-N6)-dimethyltransferase